MKYQIVTAVAVGLLACGGAAYADDSATPSVPSEHQLMKECMAKEKASDGGMPKEDMKKSCKDVTATERENDMAEKKSEDQTEPPPKQ